MRVDLAGANEKREEAGPKKNSPEPWYYDYRAEQLINPLPLDANRTFSIISGHSEAAGVRHHAPSRRAISCSATWRSMTANERLVRS